MQIILNFTNSKQNFTDTVIVNRQYCVVVKIVGMQITLNFTNSNQTKLCGCENNWNAAYTKFH